MRDPSSALISTVLSTARSIAVVGVSSDPARPSYEVAAYLVSCSPGYDVWFVNPVEADRGVTILDRPVYASLDELPVVPDIVDVFRRAEACPAIATDAVAVGARCLWLQQGIRSEEARSIASGGGLDVVMDRCIKVDHARWAMSLDRSGTTRVPTE